MVSKKDIISELKKYNDELEKHVPGLDFDLIKEQNLYNTSKSDDYFTLFAENLVDLRTEIALMRKNLSTDVEGMVLRVVNQQQNQFSQRMNDFFVKAVLDVKETWDSRLTGFVDEISELKKVFNEMKIQNENSSETVKNVLEEIMLLRSSVNEHEMKAQSMELRKRLDKIESLVKGIALNSTSQDLDLKVSAMEKSLKALNLSSFKSSVTHKLNDFESHVDDLFKHGQNLNSLRSGVSKKLNEIEGKLEEMKANDNLNGVKDNLNKKITELETKIDSFSENFNFKNTELESKFQSFSDSLSKQSKDIEINLSNVGKKVFDIEERNKDSIKNIEIIEAQKVSMQQPSQVISVPKKIKESTSTKKLLEVERRLSKLNSLR